MTLEEKKIAIEKHCFSRTHCVGCPLIETRGDCWSTKDKIEANYKILFGDPEQKQKKFDVVSHPSHYTKGRKYEVWKVIRDWGLNFNLGSAVKYIARAGRKDDILQDLKKAKQFIEFEIEAIEGERDGSGC